MMADRANTDRKTEILEAAIRLLARDGIAQASTRRLAAEVGINQATLLYHIGSKDELLLAVLREMMRQTREIAVAAAIVLASMPTTINIGVRHVLAIYPLLAMTAAYGCVELWRQTRWRAVAPSVAAGLVAWQAVEAARAHPDYLPYFNEFAGRHPERLLLDSDLDWGQDLLRLADTVRVSRIRDITVAYYGSTDMRRMIPADAHFLRPYDPVTGWLAVSETYLANPNPEFAGYRWVRTLTPVAHVGKSIKLFYVPPRSNASPDGAGAPAPRADTARSRASP